MLRPRQRNLLIGTFAVLVAVALAVVPGLRYSPSSLLTHAHKVATLNDWTAKPSNYFWLSNHEVLLIATAGYEAESTSQETQAHRLDIQTGTIKEDRPLEAALNNMGPDTVVSQWQLSPDACWLLSDDSYLQNTPPALIVTAVNGTKQFTRPRHEEYMRDGIFTVWRPDSKSWVQMVEENNQVSIYTYQVADPAIVKHTENTNLNGNVAIGFYSQDRLFCLRPRTGDGGGIGIMDLGVDAASVPVKNFIQDIPPNMDIQEVVLSPDRTHLAWKFTVRPLLLGIEATINSSYVRRSSPYEAGLWTSDLNFNHLHEIGAVYCSC